MRRDAMHPAMLSHIRHSGADEWPTTRQAGRAGREFRQALGDALVWTPIWEAETSGFGSSRLLPCVSRKASVHAAWGRLSAAKLENAAKALCARFLSNPLAASRASLLLLAGAGVAPPKRRRPSGESTLAQPSAWLRPKRACAIITNVAKALIGATLLIAVAALAVAIAAFREARAPNERPTLGEVTAAGVREITEAGNRVTPAEVVQLLGKPAQVYRNNPRALCWRYVVPYLIEICWGPKRQQALIGNDIPRGEFPP